MLDTATRLLAWLRGGNGPLEVALAVGLGFTAGFSTGWNLIVLAIVVSAVAFHLHLRSFLVAWCIAWACGWLLLPQTVAVGRALLDHTAFGALPAALGDHYWAVLLDLDRYAVAGGLAIGMACGSILAIAAWRLTRDTHRRLNNFSPDVSFQAFGTAQIFYETLGFWLMIEPATATSASVDTPPRWRLRSKWIIAVPLSLVLAIAVLGIAVPRAIKRGVLDELTRINAAPVTASRVEISLQGREISLVDVRFADPADPNIARLRIGRAKARLRVPAMALRGVWHLEDVVLEDVRVDEKLKAAGGAGLTTSESPDGTSDSDPSRNSAGTVDLPLKRHSPRIADLVQHMACVETTAAIGRKIVELEMPPIDTHASWWERRAALRSLRSRLGSKQPRVVVEQLWVKQLPASWRLGPGASLRIDRLASRTSDDDEPANLTIEAPAVAMRMQAKLRSGSQDLVHDVQCQFSDLRLVEWIGPVANTDRLTAYGGQLSLDVEGRVLEGTIDLHVDAVADKPRLRLSGQEPWCGVSPAVWNRGFAEFDSFSSRFRVLGTWDQPMLRVDQHRLEQQLKQQLAALDIRESGLDAIQPERSSDADTASPRMAEDTGTTPAESVLPVENSQLAAEETLAAGADGDESDLVSNDTIEVTPPPLDVVVDHSSPAAEAAPSIAETTPSYTDYSTNPLLASIPPPPATSLPGIVPPLPEVTVPRVSDQSLETADIAGEPEAADVAHASSTGLRNPLRSANLAPQQPARTTPAEEDPMDTNAPYNDTAITHELEPGGEEESDDQQIALPESIAKDSPGLIGFESGYDQPGVPRVDSVAVDPIAIAEGISQETIEEVVLPPITRDLPRRTGRIARWSRNVATSVRKLWTREEGPNEDVAADTPRDVDNLDFSGVPPLDDEPVMQARRTTKTDDTRPWYRRLW